MQVVVMVNSGMGGSLDNTCRRDVISRMAVATSKVQERFVMGGRVRARPKAVSERVDKENIPEVTSTVPW